MMVQSEKQSEIWINIAHILLSALRIGVNLT